MSGLFQILLDRGIQEFLDGRIIQVGRRYDSCASINPLFGSASSPLIYESLDRQISHAERILNHQRVDRTRTANPESAWLKCRTRQS